MEKYIDVKNIAGKSRVIVLKPKIKYTKVIVYYQPLTKLFVSVQPKLSIFVQKCEHVEKLVSLVGVLDTFLSLIFESWTLCGWDHAGSGV